MVRRVAVAWWSPLSIAAALRSDARSERDKGVGQCMCLTAPLSAQLHLTYALLYYATLAIVAIRSGATRRSCNVARSCLAASWALPSRRAWRPRLEPPPAAEPGSQTTHDSPLTTVT